MHQFVRYLVYWVAVTKMIFIISGSLVNVVRPQPIYVRINWDESEELSPDINNHLTPKPRL